MSQVQASNSTSCVVQCHCPKPLQVQDVMLPENLTQLGPHSYCDKTQNTKRNVFGYVRIFPDKYTAIYRPNLAVLKQVKAITSWVKANGLFLNQIFYDIAVPSQDYKDHPALTELIKRADTIFRVVTTSYNNLGYNQPQFDTVVGQLSGKSALKVICIDIVSNLDQTKITEKLMFELRVMASFWLMAADRFDQVYYGRVEENELDENLIEKGDDN